MRQEAQKPPGTWEAESTEARSAPPERAYRLAFAVVRYFSFGGMQRNLLRIARACAARGHEVHVFTSAWSGPRPAELTVTTIDVRAWTNHGRNERFGRAVRETTVAQEFDCIVGSNRLPGLDVYYAGDPCFAATADASSAALRRLLPRYRSYLRQETEVFGPGRDTEILLTAHGEKPRFMAHHGTEPERFHLLPPGIDRARLEEQRPDAAARQALRAELGIGEGELLLLSVGSSFRTKGVDRSITALGSLPPAVRAQARLIIVGEGRDAGLARLAGRLGVRDRVAFVGPREDLAAFYGSADLLLHPAVMENTGNVLLEALVCGLPVLATACCGYAFHVERAGAGLLCPSPFAQRDLNAHLLRLLTEEDRARLHRHALAYCDEVDLYSMVDRAADVIIDRAARNRARRRPAPAVGRGRRADG